EVDRLLIDAWVRLSDRAREDRVFAARRAARTARAVLRHPPRAWCVALRACATRLPGYACIEDADPDGAATPLGAQRLAITGAAVRALCAPVSLQLPTPIAQAAAMLGATDHGLRRWVRRGVLQ